MSEIDDRIAPVASTQHAAFTLAQVVECGGDRRLSQRRCDQGRWRREGPHVFVIAGSPRSFLQRIKVAELAAGTGAAVSHRTACHLHGLDGFRLVPIEVTVPYGRKPVLPPWVTRHKSRDLHLVPSVTIDAISVTPLGRSLLDLGAVEPGRVGAAIDSARRHHDLAWAELLNVLILHARRGRAGVGPLRWVLAHHYGDPKFDSRTESRGLTILRDAGVPKPVMHHPVVAADGVEVELDMAWPNYRAGAEVDGLDHLAREELMHKDRRKWNQLKLAGWEFVIYTGRMLREGPDLFAADVLAMLRSRGWPGDPVLPAVLSAPRPR